MKKGTKAVKEALKTDFSQVIEAIKGLREEFNAKLAEMDAKIVEKTTICVPKQETVETSNTLPGKDEFPIPQEYREAIKTILSDKFGIKVIPSGNSPSFMLQILVPREYSNAGEQIWKDAKADIRSKMITYGEGVLGVKTYIELVKDNLGPEINARIQQDKEK
jgi:hypothetical protein